MRKLRTTHDDYETTTVLDSSGRTIGTVSRDLTLPGLWSAYRWTDSQTSGQDFPNYRDALSYVLA